MYPQFGITQDHFTLEGGQFKIKGVVYVPFAPGYLPWEFEHSDPLPTILMARIDEDIDSIISLGVNTIRLWGAPRYCYEKIAEKHGLYILQTIWLDAEHPDFHSSEFLNSSKALIDDAVEKFFSVLPSEDPPIIAYLIGNELARQNIINTDLAHPGQHSFIGEYIQTDTSLTATEAILAELADYLKQRVVSYTSLEPLVSYANEVRTFDIIDTPFLDFRSYNVYSYGIEYFIVDPPAGSSSGTITQGWLEELKQLQSDLPLLVTETGLSISPETLHSGPPNYGYGGNTEADQAAGIMQTILDIETASSPIAGVVVHEFNDAWWKFGLEDSYTQDPADVEEWFGIVRFVDKTDGYSISPRESYRALRQHWTQSP